MKTATHYFLLSILLVASLILAGYVFYAPGPCQRPLAYSIGHVDEEFGMSTSTFQEVIHEAEKVWESDAGKDLFVYDPSASYTVNLVFDERQQNTIISNEIQQDLQDLEGAREDVLVEYERLVAQHEAKERQFEMLKAEYVEEVAAYNEDLEDLQEQKTVTQEEIDEMNQRQAQLEDMQQEVESVRLEVNRLVNEINQIAEREHSIVDEYNSKAGTYQDLYGVAREFEQGHATQNEINIYQFNQRDDLRLVLAHEFGHTLGIDHVNDPEAVMYWLMEHQSLDPIELSSSDRAELTKMCSQPSWRFL